MKLIYPSYYNDFSCIAGACKKSCCEGWALEIDEETYEYYKQVPGEIGEKIRSVIDNASPLVDEDEDVGAVFCLEVDGRCPFLEDDGLCTIVKALGQESLCSICATYPRSSFTYGDTTELFYTLSCEEACRLHFDRKNPYTFDEMDEPSADEYIDDEEPLFSGYPELRDELTELILSDIPFEPLIEALCIRLAGIQGIDPEVLMKAGYLYNIRERIHILQGLEPLDPSWDDMLSTLVKQVATGEHKHALAALYDSLDKPVYNFYVKRLLLYFIRRYLPSAIYDMDFKGKLAFCIFCVQAVLDFFASNIITESSLTEEKMQLIISAFSRECEHSEENLDFLFEELLFA